ncbi:hypothetical protein COTS27_00701 [Spirochaetota bacterium]|nr:hypothetical protein COTS27_00701 [Spirochaetota bacterium]
MLHIAIDARYISSAPLGGGFRTYLAYLLHALHRHYINKKKRPYYHFHLWSIHPIHLTATKLPKHLMSVHLLKIPAHISPCQEKSYYLKAFQSEVLNHTPKINIVFFPHLELPGAIKKWSHANIKVVLTIHDLIPTHFIKASVLFSRKMRLNALNTKGIEHYLTLKLKHRFYDKILTVSPTSKQQILNVIGQAYNHKIVVTPLAGAASFKPYTKASFEKCIKDLMKRYPSFPSTLRYKCYILYFGSHTVRKNIALGMRACIEVLNTLPQLSHFTLVTVGSGRWMHEMTRKNLHHHISCLSNLAERDLAVLVAGARFTLQPSLIEGFDLPVLESIRAQTLPICSDIATHRDILGPTYPYFDPYRISDIKRVVEQFLTIDKREEAALLAQTKAHIRKFTWQKTALLTHKVFQELSSLS